MEQDKLRRVLLVATIAALSLTALIAIAALIAAEFGETELRILATTAGFGFATLLAMRGTVLLDQGRHQRLARAVIGFAALAFIVELWPVWINSDDSAPWKGVLAPVAIGGFIFVAAVTIGPTSGGSFNPARSIDPAIWALEFRNLWIYIVGPLIGAAIAGGLSMAIRDELPEPTESART